MNKSTQIGDGVHVHRDSSVGATLEAMEWEKQPPGRDPQ